MLVAVSAPALALFLSVSFTLALRRLMVKLGVVGVDVHKPERPIVPEHCGLAITLSFLFALIPMVATGRVTPMTFLIYLGTAGTATLIGLIDRWADLSGVEKPLLTLSLGLPVLIWGGYEPYIRLPLGGEAHLPVVYPLLIPLALAITSNAVNMLDVLNGAMASSSALVCLFVAATSFLLGNQRAALLLVTLAASLIGFLLFNKYPAKVFAGDVGSLSVGSILGLVAITEKLEFLMLIAMLPYILNSFLILSSVGGLIEHKELARRPTKLRDDGLIEATVDAQAPITLVRLLVSREPKPEPEIVKEIAILFVVAGALAVITALTFW